MSLSSADLTAIRQIVKEEVQLETADMRQGIALIKDVLSQQEFQDLNERFKLAHI